MLRKLNYPKVRIVEIFNVLILTFISVQINSQNLNCVNGDFEFQNMGGWTGKYGYRNSSGVNLNSLSIGFNTSHHQIQSGGFDPEVGGTILPTVGEGNYSIRLGNSSPNKDASVLQYTFTVTNLNKDFGFMYAMVMQDGEHKPAIKNPYFSYMIFEGIAPVQPTWFQNGNIIAQKLFIADLDSPFFKKSSGWVYKDWSFECVDLSPYLGKTVTILFLVTDCSQGGHAGYAYIDGLCTDNDAISCLDLPAEVCLSSPAFADASCSINEDSHFWSIQECTSNGIGVGVEYSKWFVAQDAGIINLHDLMHELGGSFSCNKYYRIKIAVSNSCTQWHETTRVMKFKCPNIDLGSDLTFCCGDDPILTFGPYEKPRPQGSLYNYEWMISPNNPNNQQWDGTEMIMSPMTNTTVALEVTDQEGCWMRDEMKVWFLPDMNIWIESEKVGCCSERLSINYEFKDAKCGSFNGLSDEDIQYLESQFNIEWSDGSSGFSTIVSATSPTLYSAMVNVGNCYNYVANYNYIPPDAYNLGASYTGQMIAPNAFEPSSSIVMRQTFNILEYGPNAPLNWGEPYAYGIIGYELSIFDLDGHVVKTIIDESCNIPQAGIMWDGTSQSGSPLPGGVYLYRLRVKTCNGPTGTWYNICGGNLVGASYDAAGTTYCAKSHFCYAFCGGGLPWWQGTWVCDEYWNPSSNTDVMNFGNNSSASCVYYVTLVR